MLETDLKIQFFIRIFLKTKTEVIKTRLKYKMKRKTNSREKKSKIERLRKYERK